VLQTHGKLLYWTNFAEKSVALLHSCDCTFKDRKATIVARILYSRNLPTDTARELMEPSKVAENLLVFILKNPGSFGFELFVG